VEHSKTNQQHCSTLLWSSTHKMQLHGLRSRFLPLVSVVSADADGTTSAAARAKEGLHPRTTAADATATAFCARLAMPCDVEGWRNALHFRGRRCTRVLLSTLDDFVGNNPADPCLPCIFCIWCAMRLVCRSWADLPLQNGVSGARVRFKTIRSR
jgi:hypothetical protein